MTEYEREARSRWGESQEYKESKARSSQYSSADFQAAKIDQEAVTELFVYTFGNSLPLNSEKVKEAVFAHREAISRWFYECSVEMQKNLAQLYISDPRFKEYYDGRVRGLAQYVHDAIMAQ